MSAGKLETSTLNFTGDALYMEEVYSELGGSIIVEHCRDCSKHAGTTRHDERKYQQYFDAVEQLVGRCFPNCEVEANPSGVLKRITGSKTPRLGTFEVYVANEDGSNKQVSWYFRMKLQDPGCINPGFRTRSGYRGGIITRWGYSGLLELLGFWPVAPHARVMAVHVQ